MIIPERAPYHPAAASELLGKEESSGLNHILFSSPPELLFALKEGQKCASLCPNSEEGKLNEVKPFIKGEAIRLDVVLMGSTPLELKQTFRKIDDVELATILAGRTFRGKLFAAQIAQNTKIAGELSNFLVFPLPIRLLHLQATLEDNRRISYF